MFTRCTGFGLAARGQRMIIIRKPMGESVNQVEDKEAWMGFRGSWYIDDLPP